MSQINFRYNSSMNQPHVPPFQSRYPFFKFFKILENKIANDGNSKLKGINIKSIIEN